MAVQTIKATIQMRYGMEADLQPDKLVTGEWAVAKDTRKVWMCFRPGLVLRMATYEAFEQDMLEVQTILATCQDIQAAVERFMQLAQQHASQAEEWSVTSKSWAVGGTGTRQGEDTNNSEHWSRQSQAHSDMSRSWAIGEGNMRPDEAVNSAKYFAEQAGRIVDAAGSGGLIPMGTVTFENLPASGMKRGWMYNVSNDFTSDSRFEDGAGIKYKAGSNAYYTAGGKWDVLTGSHVTGVKGSAETNYRSGDVNITKANVGLGNVPNVTTNNQVPTFSQASARTNIASGEKLSVILGKIMKWYADLKTVAFTGKYSDLSGRPAIPSVTNNLLATIAGTALDAVQGKLLSDRLNEINSNLALTRGTADKGEKFNLGAYYYIWGRMCFVTLESTPSSDVSNGDVVLTGLPLPCTVIYLSLQTAGGNYSSRIRKDGILEIYFPSYKTASRIDTSFCYIT